MEAGAMVGVESIPGGASGRLISPTTSTIPIKQGWLHKLGGKGQAHWQRRYFRLRGPSLQYFKSTHEASTAIVLGEIQLHKAEISLQAGLPPSAASSSPFQPTLSPSSPSSLPPRRRRDPNSMEEDDGINRNRNGAEGTGLNWFSRKAVPHVLVLHIKDGKTFYLKGISEQDLQLWYLHLLLVQRSFQGCIASRRWLHNLCDPPTPDYVPFSGETLPRHKFRVRNRRSPFAENQLLARFFSVEPFPPFAAAMCETAEDVLLTNYVDMKQGAFFFKETPQARSSAIFLSSFAQMEPGAGYTCIDRNPFYLRISRLNDCHVLVNGSPFPFTHRPPILQPPFEIGMEEEQPSATNGKVEEENDGDDEAGRATDISDDEGFESDTCRNRMEVTPTGGFKEASSRTNSTSTPRLPVGSIYVKRRSHSVTFGSKTDPFVTDEFVRDLTKKVKLF